VSIFPTNQKGEKIDITRTTKTASSPCSRDRDPPPIDHPDRRAKRGEYARPRLRKKSYGHKSGLVAAWPAPPEVPRDRPPRRAAGLLRIGDADGDLLMLFADGRTARGGIRSATRRC
jgi:hypothetical protein